MNDNDLMIVREHEVRSLLDGRELELVAIVQRAYEAHAAGASCLPHSTFVRFPDRPRDRIIALPAYVGAPFEQAGIKWISSFPDNHARGLDRASAVVILNDPVTGRPQTIVEGSLISARRTAASAALAAHYLHRDAPIRRAGLIGCGVINLEVARFLLALNPELAHFVIYDLDPSGAERFRERLHELSSGVDVTPARSVDALLASSSLTSIATTALEPHIRDLSACRPGSTILHISLRDLAPEVVLGCDNVVDDLDHVCRAATSIHLAEQLSGQRDFVRCSLAEIVRGTAAARSGDGKVSVFSPFGLGVLDIAVGQYVAGAARAAGRGVTVESFFSAR